ncbi:hypothetical protein AZI86_08235 [Bdellovibrio bacteriovorus]|uniref:HTH cro/C1-type domain-containing protein n=1 Tax=Bdellovibrio bacteriovorus TaxID=959 RepID=A0A150WRE0_BDEBC|nr:TIGR02147 family protein [Bdellovibrio bacteriovorus]KYG67000.1 hypothetical protein AZI86_08235 [Bdellovibrio bacteriovorus]
MILDEQQHIRQVLTDYFVRASQKNPSFSLRAFAKKLEISSSALSEIMRGKRKISLSKALILASKIGLSDKEIQKIRSIFERKSSIDKLTKLSNPFREVILKPNEFDLLADWKFFAIVALMRTKGFKSENSWIAKRLSLTEAEVAQSLQRLIDLGIVQKDRRGNLSEQKCSYRTSEDYPDELIRSRQVEGLSAAIKSIQSAAKGQMGFYSTISADIRNIDKAPDMIEEFLKKFSIFLHEGDPSEVFEFHIQLFPRTRI